MQLTLGVLRRKKEALSILAAFEVHGEMLIHRQEEAFEEIREEGVEMPNYRANLVEQKIRLEAAYDRLEKADDEHLEEDANDRTLRRHRDAKTGELHHLLVDVSINLDRKHGKGTAEEYLGLGTGLRPIPDHIHDIARRAANKLGREGFSFPESDDEEGVNLVPELLKAEIEEHLTELSDALRDLRLERKKFNLTLQRKNAAIEHFDRTRAVSASWLKYALRSIGEDMLAERVRDKIPKSAPGDNKVVDDDTEKSESEGSETPAEADSGTAAESEASETPSKTAESETGPSAGEGE